MQRIADYDIVQPLGEGNQSQYWYGRAPARLGIGDSMVAIKTYNHAATDTEFDRMTEHLTLYASVTSSHLLRLYDVGQQGAIVYIAGDYLAGGSLARPARPFSRIDVLRAMADAARGAHALHEIGIAHRAIRPGNVLLSDNGAKLGDVSISHLLSPGQTITSAAQMGTIEHLSPELVQGQPPSRSSDLWALAATMHKVLTGQSFFPELPTDSLVSALRHLLTQRPTMGDALRNGERHIIESCVEADPATRTSTGEQLADAIQAEADRQAEQVQS